MIKITSIIWLSFIGMLVIWYGSHPGMIERHQLHRVLLPGYDAFGRDCIELTILAISQSIQIVAPLSLLCLITSLSFALFSTFFQTNR